MYFSSGLSFAVISNLALTSTAHMIFNTGATWGISTQGSGLETPLNMATGSKWPNHFASKDTQEVITFTPSESSTQPVTCGEAAGNPGDAPSACTVEPDFHGGGGCALSIAYNNPNPSPEDFIVFSVVHDCPTFNQFDHSFAIPSNLPACESCVCAWHWVPDENFSADEMYMNTFNCAVAGSNTGKISGKKPNYFGVVDHPTSKNGERPMYKTTFPDGAQTLQVSSAKRWVA